MSRKTIDENNELMTTQPFNVAFGKHEVSSIEDNILTTIGGTDNQQGEHFSRLAECCLH